MQHPATERFAPGLLHAPGPALLFKEFGDEEVAASTIMILLLLAQDTPPADRAAPPPRLLEEVTRCRAVADEVKRLACYDAHVGALADAAEKRAVILVDQEEVRRTRRSLFGFTLPRLPLFGNTGKSQAETNEEVREIASTVTRVTASGYGLWSMNLAQGGTWRTLEADRRLVPGVGEKITIRRGLLGNYLATIGDRRAVRVVRIG